MFSTLSTLAMLLALAAIAVGDVRTLRISNRTLVAAYALAALWYVGHPAAFDLTVPLMGTLFFAVGFGLWLAGGFGGGDAKALPLAGLFAGAAFVPETLIALSFASICLVATSVALRSANARLAPGGTLARYAEHGRVPLGVPIAAAAAAALLCRAALA